MAEVGYTKEEKRSFSISVVFGVTTFSISRLQRIGGRKVIGSRMQARRQHSERKEKKNGKREELKRGRKGRERQARGRRETWAEMRRERWLKARREGGTRGKR